MVNILSELLPEWEVVTLAGYPEFSEPEETADTYAENAAIKAEATRDAIGELCIADDAGLEIDAMDGAPGVKSKRFAGVDSPFSEKISRILAHLQANPSLPRTARFRCAVAIAQPGGGAAKVFESTKEGSIADAPRGERGFGYDPVFVVDGLGRTYAELDPAEKNRISHRGLVLREAAAWLSGIAPAK